MLLSQAIRKNVISLAQAQNAYLQNVITVNTYIVSVLASSIPPFLQDPPDYEDFSSSYTKARVEASGWINHVLVDLLSIPSDVLGYSNIITSVLNDATSQANTLLENPTDKVALNMLQQDFIDFIEKLKLVFVIISDALANIQSFKNILPDLATQLQTIANDSANDASADIQQINQLTDDIQNLKQDIASLQESIIGLGSADVFSLTIGILSSIILFPTGFLSWFALGPVVAVASTYIGFDAAKIVSDNAKITSDQNQLSNVTADCATLFLLANNFKEMANEAQTIESNLSAVFCEWVSLQHDVSDAIDEITLAIKDCDHNNLKTVLTDISNAASDWNDANLLAGLLNINIEVNTASLQIGMSETDVQNALSNGQTMSFIDYCNQAL